LQEAFNDDRDFKNCIQSDFEHFLNISQKAPEFLSLYIDDKLKKGLRSVYFLNFVDFLWGLFPYLTHFEDFYR